MSRSSTRLPGRIAYLTGLSYRSLYQQDPWLRDFLDQPQARWQLLGGRWSTLAVITMSLSAMGATRYGTSAILMGLIVSLAVGPVLWRVLPQTIERDRHSFEEPPLDPKTAPSLWRRKRE